MKAVATNNTQHGGLADCSLVRCNPGGDEPTVDPQIRVGNRSGQDVGKEDECASHSQSEESIETSRLCAARAFSPRPVERKGAEMLCREVVSHQGVVEYRHAHEPLPAGPRIGIVGRQEDGKARARHQQREQDEPYRLDYEAAAGKLPCSRQARYCPDDGRSRTMRSARSRRHRAGSTPDWNIHAPARGRCGTSHSALSIHTPSQTGPRTQVDGRGVAVSAGTWTAIVSGTLIANPPRCGEIRAYALSPTGNYASL